MAQNKIWSIIQKRPLLEFRWCLNLNLLPCSEEDPNDKANSSDNEGIVKKEEWPIDYGMALGPIAEIAIGWGPRPSYGLRHLFHGGVGIAIRWGHLATIAALPAESAFKWRQYPADRAAATRCLGDARRATGSPVREIVKGLEDPGHLSLFVRIEGG